VVDPENWNSDQLEGGKFFKDKIVLIGATAASKQDIQNSAVGRMAGIEIHAKPGEKIVSGSALFTLHSDDSERFERAKQALEGAVSISEKGEVAERLPLVITKF
jgi:thymidine phosphorylase